MKKQIFRVGALTAVAGLVFGVASIAGASSATIDTTGAGSDNIIKYENELALTVDNNNNVDVWNVTPQIATTGRAEVEHNTVGGGSATTGDATNDNKTSATVAIDNSGSNNWVGWGSEAEFDASIGTTGEGSTNVIRAENEANVSVVNDNEVDLVNVTLQYARSGNAEVEGNTEGGDATSGNASNYNDSTFCLEITN